jgi:hypothetical protein
VLPRQWRVCDFGPSADLRDPDRRAVTSARPGRALMGGRCFRMEVGDWARVHNHARQNGQADHRRDRRHRVSPARANLRDPIPSHPIPSCTPSVVVLVRNARACGGAGTLGVNGERRCVRGGNGSGLVASPLGCFAGMMRRQGWCPRVGPSRCKHKLTQHDREGAGMIPTPAPTPTSSHASRTSSPTWTPAPGCCVGVARIAQRGRLTLSRHTCLCRQPA